MRPGSVHMRIAGVWRHAVLIALVVLVIAPETAVARPWSPSLWDGWRASSGAALASRTTRRPWEPARDGASEDRSPAAVRDLERGIVAATLAGRHATAELLADRLREWLARDRGNVVRLDGGR